MATLRVAIDASGASAGAAEWERSTLRIVTGANNVHSAVIRMMGAFAAGGAVFAAVDSMKKFEFTMAQLKGVTGATAEEFRRLERAARDLGATSKYGATEAAEAMLAFSKAGLSVNEAIGATPAALQLATAHAFELEEAAEIVANTMRQFGLDSKQATRIIDDLSVTANLSTIDVRDLAGSLKFAGGLAHTAGLQIEEVTAAIGVLGNVGIKRFLAGTNLRGIMSTLLDPTPPPQSVDALSSLGLRQSDVDLRTNTLTEVFTKLRDAGLGVQTALQLFRRENANAALALAKHIDQIDMFVEKQREGVGSTEALADTMNDTFVGSLAHAKNSLEAMFISWGGKSNESGFLGSLRAGVDVISDVALHLAGMDDKIRGNKQTIDTLTRSIEGGLTFALTMSLIPAVVRATSALKALTLSYASSPLGLAAVGVAAAAGTVAAYGDRIPVATGPQSGQSISLNEAAPSFFDNLVSQALGRAMVLKAGAGALLDRGGWGAEGGWNAIMDAMAQEGLRQFGNPDEMARVMGPSSLWGGAAWGTAITGIDEAKLKEQERLRDAKLASEFDIESYRSEQYWRNKELAMYPDAEAGGLGPEKEFDAGLRVKQRLTDMIQALRDERSALSQNADEAERVKKLREAENFLLEHRVEEGGLFLAQLRDEIELTQQARSEDSIKQRTVALNQELATLGMTSEQVQRLTDWQSAYSDALRVNTAAAWDNLEVFEAAQKDNSLAKMEQYLKDRAKALREETELLGLDTYQRLEAVAAREAEAKAISLGLDARETEAAMERARQQQHDANVWDVGQWRDDQVKTLREERALIGLSNPQREMMVKLREAEKKAIDAGLPSLQAFVDSLREEYAENQRLEAMDWYAKRMKAISEENDLIGKNSEERDRAVALREAEDELIDHGVQGRRALLDAMKAELELGSRRRGYEWQRDNLKTLREEKDLIFMTNEERELEVKLREARNNAMEHGIPFGEQETELYTTLITQMQKMRELKNLADAVGASFSNALADLIVSGREANEVLQGLVMTVYRLVFDQVAGAPLAKLISSGITGLFGGMVGAENGRVFAAGGVTPFALGGRLVTSPTLTPLAKGGMALYGEHSPGEVVFPLKRMGDGRLGISVENGAGAGGGNVVVQMTVVTKDADSFRRSQAQIASGMQRAAMAATKRS